MSYWGGKGSDNGNSKLNEEMVAQIKFDLAMGESVKTLMVRYNIGKTALYNIKSGRAWGHVKVPTGQ